MKIHIKNISFLLLALPFLQACSEDFLNRAPLTELSSSTFWTNESDVQAALVGLYAPLTWGGGGYASGLYAPAEWDGTTDNGFATYNYGGMQSLIKQGVNPNSGGFVPVMYSQTYQAIAAVNDFLANIDRVELDPDAKNQYLAEARFLRGFYYFQLARTFGNVPLVLTPPQEQDATNPLGNTPKTEIISQVHDDVDFAILNLPNEAYADGHVVKGTAQALKMHNLLLEDKFSEAAAVGKEIIDSGVFSLAGSYNDNFTKPGQNSNPEIMFSVKWNPADSYFDPAVDLFIGVWQAIQPSHDLVEEYETINGLLPQDDPAFDANDPYSNRDPRLKMTVFTPGDNWGALNANSDTFQPGELGDVTGFAMKKFINLPATEPPSYSTLGDQDWLIFRYADVLLMYAEAENEVNGPTQEAYNAINALRDRVGMPDLPTGLTQGDFRTRVRRERRIELAFENWRYFDLRRWGTAVDELNGSKVLMDNLQDAETPGKYESHYDLWAIPQNVLNKNPSLEQNPGYN